MLTRILEVVLFLNLTGLFSFVAVQIGVPLAAMSAATMVFLIAYLVVNYKCSLWYLRRKTVFLWSCFVFVWPALTLAYAAIPDLRASAVNLYLILLMLSAAVWFTKSGIRRAGTVFVVAALVSFFGLILSIVGSDYFQAVAEIANARFAYHGRAFGFYLQPNVAAENLCFLFAILVPIAAQKGNSAVIVCSALFAAAVLVTGSRGGMIIATLILVYAHLGGAQAIASTGRFAHWKKVGVLTGVVVAVVGTIQLVGMYSGGGTDLAGFSLADRVRAFVSLDFVGGGMLETAISRIGAFNEHWPGIVDNPLLGQGVASSQNFAAAGRFSFASHNQYLQVAFELGVPALVFYLYLLGRLWKRRDSRVEPLLTRGFHPTVLLVIAITLAGLFSNSVLNSRVLFIVLGVIFAIQSAPAQVFWDRSIVVQRSPALPE